MSKAVILTTLEEWLDLHTVLAAGIHILQGECDINPIVDGLVNYPKVFITAAGLCLWKTIHEDIIRG